MPQLGAVHIGVLGQRVQEAGIGPAERRLGLLRNDGIAGVRRQRAEHLDLAHQAGIHADQLEFVQAGLGADLAERWRPARSGTVVVRALPRECAMRSPPPRRIASLQPPGQPMPWSDRISTYLSAGISLHGPGDKVDQRVGVRHVDLAQVGHQLRADAQVVVLRDKVAPGAGPVAVA